MSCNVTTSQDSPGFVHRKPQTGYFVKTQTGYMIPYKKKIPGTEVEFQMIPIPGGMVKLRFPTRPDNSDTTDFATLTTEPFWMGRCEVTWAEYDRFCNLNRAFREFAVQGIRKVPKEKIIDAVTTPSELYDPSMYFPTGDKRNWRRYPATGMTQYAAKQYTKWLSKLTGNFYRLPSEGEWEHACRSGATTKFHFGDDVTKLKEFAWFRDNANRDSHQVGEKKPNAWGLHDMHGNVAEWVLDGFSRNSPPFRESVMTGQNINWPKSLHPRSVKGGAWDSQAKQCQRDSRVGSSKIWHEEDSLLPVSPTWLASAKASRQVGFRIARPYRSVEPKKQYRYWEADNEELKKSLKTYTSNGHSYRGMVDPELPKAISKLNLNAKK